MAWKIDHEFLCWLKEYNTPLAELLLEYRANASKTAPSNHLVAIAEASSLFLRQYLDLKLICNYRFSSFCPHL